MMNLFPDTTDPYSVFELTTYIRQVVESDVELQDVWVEGEISRPTRPSSGHWYFTLKDDRSELKAVMWKTTAARQRYQPEHGQKVRAHGRISVYEARGEYQLLCDGLIPLDAMGDLHARFRQLWDKLEAEGLFDPEIKRPLPAFPQRIGVVTSPTTAAFQDIQNVLRRRYPLAEVILSPTPVQGEDAPPKILEALRRIDRYGVDVILLARGGGSIEDLWCFNDEGLARAIRKTRAPVVTGVGHETDTTLVDGPSDQRAPTPSAGAEMITPNIEDLLNRLDDLALSMVDAGNYALQTRRDGLSDLARALRLISPASRIRNDRQRLDDLGLQMGKVIVNNLASHRQGVRTQERALTLANPYNLLARGYAIVTRMDGKRLTDAADAGPGTTVNIQLDKGQLTATVKDRKIDDRPSR